MALTPTLAASAQTDATIQDSTASSPVAYVYVSGGTYKTSEIYAYKAASDGKLTSVTGSPFRASVDLGMALNQKYLFTTDGTYIYSFSIESDGAIKQVASINVLQFDSGCGYPDTLFLDPTGATLYDVDGNYDCSGSGSAYQSFSIDSSSGELSFLGATAETRSSYVPLSFIGTMFTRTGHSVMATCTGRSSGSSGRTMETWTR
jgi:6-phosphogluconolactonase (cycloisomerase 2 family)